MRVIYQRPETLIVQWEFLDGNYPEYKSSIEFNTFNEYQKIINGEKFGKKSDTQNYYTSVEWAVGLSHFRDKKYIDDECRKRQSEIIIGFYNKAIENLKK